MYCTAADIRLAVAGTDDGTGTCAMLTDAQLNGAIAQASAKVSAYVGTDYEPDAASPSVTVPDLVKGLTVQLGTFYGTLIYRKGKDLAAYDPVLLGYNDAIATLKDIASGLIDVAAPTPGAPDDAPGHVVNPSPKIFTMHDSGVVSDGRGGITPEGAPGSVFGDPWSWR
jgi:phage gp36-like protein